MSNAFDRAGVPDSEHAAAGRGAAGGLVIWADAATRALLTYAAVLALFATALLAAQAALGKAVASQA